MKTADAMNRIWLGTVQIGLPYGLAARQPDADTSARLLDAAWACGIRRFDTARAYGVSEERIGTWMRMSGRRPVLATKIPSLKEVAAGDRAAAMERALNTSLSALGVERVDYLMLHRAEDIQDPAVLDRLLSFAETGQAGAIGISGYAPEVLLQAIDRSPEIRIVQCPGSVADIRFRENAIPQEMAARDGVLVLRSLFLQGGLLMPESSLPEHLAPLKPLRRAVARIAEAAGLTVSQAALRLALSDLPMAQVVLGAETEAQIAEMASFATALKPWPASLPADLFRSVETARRSLPLSVLDPRLWPK